MWQRLFVYSLVFSFIWLWDYWWYTEKPLFHVLVNIYLLDVYLILTAVSITSSFLLKKETLVFRSSVSVAMMVYIAWVMVCVVRGIPVWGYSAVGESRLVLSAFLYFSVVYAVRDIKTFERVLKVCLLLAATRLIYVLIQRFFVDYGGDFLWMMSSKPIGTYLGLLATSIIVFFLVFLAMGLVKKHRIAVIFTIVFLGLLCLFGSRTPALALTVSTVFVILVTLRRARLNAKMGLLLMTMVLVGVAMDLNSRTGGVLVDSMSSSGIGFVNALDYGTVGWRLGGWRTLIQETLALNPILGQGFGGYYDIFYSEQYAGVAPHNEWLVIFSKMGVIGLILFISVVIQLYRIGFKYINASKDTIRQAYMKGLLAVFTAGLIGGTFFFFFPFMWIAAGLHTALVNISKNEARKYRLLQRQNIEVRKAQ